MGKKLVLVFSIFLFSFVLLFAFIPNNNVAYAESTVKTFDDTKVSSDFSNIGNYAIDNIESLSIEGATVYKVDLDILHPVISETSHGLTFTFLSRYGGSYSYTGDYFYYNCSNNNWFHLNFPFAFRATDASSYIKVSCSNEKYGEWAGLSWYKIYVYLNKNCEIYFGPVAFGGTKDNMTIVSDSSYSQFISRTYNSSDYDFSSFLDMNSNTDFSLEYSNFDLDFSYGANGFGKYLYNKLLYGNIDFSQTLTGGSWSEWYGKEVALKSGTTTLCSPSFSYFVSAVGSNCTIYGYSKSTVFNTFDFSIYRPVYRTNNTLVFYNYDYLNFFNRIKGVKYRLRRNDIYYDCVYSGNLPNSYFVYLYNENTANIVFDEYIYLYLTIDNSFSNLDFYYTSTSSGGSSSSKVVQSLKLGFDFNFTYYTNPLVSSTGSFNYTFEKPSYVEARFSLYPFYIPVLELIQNALIWLMFYCDITAPIFSFIHLDEFFGTLFNIFSFSADSVTILGLNIGNFLFSCIAFLIFFKLLQSFMPIMWSQTKGVPSAVNEDFNRIAIKIRHKENLKEKETLKTSIVNLKKENANLKKERTTLKKRKSKYGDLYDNLDDLKL